MDEKSSSRPARPGTCAILLPMPRRVAVLSLVLALACPALAGAVNRQGGPGPDQLLGTPGRDVLNGRGGDDDLRGGAGNDRLVGGRGNDFISGDAGNDTINGGPGDDTLLGGAGGDTIVGGRGSDRIAGGEGRDTIRAVDGELDHISCGAGRDRVFVDAQDDVAGDCEKVVRGG
jgi:Ca2+-binding RTX toxin-like protein